MGKPISKTRPMECTRPRLQSGDRVSAYLSAKAQVHALNRDAEVGLTPSSANTESFTYEYSSVRS
jgi:hypothetical protein